MLVSFFEGFRQFVYSLAREFPENLESKLESELKYLETKVNDLDIMLAKCGQLRNEIVFLEKLANNSSNYNKHNYRSLVKSSQMSDKPFLISLFSVHLIIKSGLCKSPILIRH
jgi:hypothetical protein